MPGQARRRFPNATLTVWLPTIVVAFALPVVAATAQVQAAPPNQQPAPAPDPPNAAKLAPRLMEMLSIQVALDRAGFSPGEIDARDGANTHATLAAFQESRQLRPTGKLDDRTRAALGPAFTQPTTTYAITEEDVAGPFIQAVPDDMMEAAKLPALSYTSPLELLGERFHASPKLLQELNPDAQFQAGEQIVVPNVEPFHLPTEKGKRKSANATAAEASAGNGTAKTASEATAPAASGQPKPGGIVTAQANAGGKQDAPRAANPAAPAALPDAHIVVEQSGRLLRVERADGTPVFVAPVTFGSPHDPLPIGEWKVTGVYLNPVFHYNPDLFWDADPSHAKAKIAPGPNNPVGPVWIGISKEHYGFHGTPEPAHVGHTQSHGCVRLTNWDAMKLASLVDEGTPVSFR